MALALLGAVAMACGGGSGAVVEPATITVLAAASLSEAFTELGTAFSAVSRPVVHVRFSFGPSSGLARQIVDGAPGDVFASADAETMEVVVAAGAARGHPQDFAANFMEMAVPPGNPAAVSGLSGLARPELLVGLCAPEVPCGRLARRLLATAEVTPAIDTEEADVRSLVTKIEAGELDAGLVYHSDVAAAGAAVDAVAVPGADQVLTRYPAVVLEGAAAPSQAEAFVDFLVSDAGRAILVAHGFR